MGKGLKVQNLVYRISLTLLLTLVALAFPPNLALARRARLSEQDNSYFYYKFKNNPA